ncbi:MAG: hypothetical protein AABW88_01705 [Nanoarchaeota archaeon]
MELIEKRLDAAGFRLLGISQSIEQLIIDILDKNDTRYLKAIPFLLYKHDVDMVAIYNRTKNPDLFKMILDMTQRIFNEFNIRKTIPAHIEFLGRRLLSGHAMSFNYIEISPSYSEFRDEFELQFRGENKQPLLIDRQKMDAERNLQYWLSQLFTKKEKTIMKRILEEKSISKTDYEYYSRRIKKKLRGILDLQDFAHSLGEKKPHYDDELFLLKKNLENWIAIKLSFKDISIQKYSTIWGDSIYIIFKQKETALSEDQLHNTVIKLTEINNKEVLSLLKKYDSADFT